MKKTIRINSKYLWDYINKLATNEKVKFKVYYDDNYVTEILWNGENFEWESGRFTSEAFFNPLYDFEPLDEEEFETIDELLIEYDDGDIGINKKYISIQQSEIFAKSINQLINNQKKIIDKLKNK